MADSELYINERLSSRIAWYDRRAVFYKRMHLIVQYTGMTASVVLVLLIHFETIPRGVLAGVAAFVTLCLAVGRTGRFGELWRTYRLSAEGLATELQLFRHAVGPYEVGDEVRTALLIQRCEGLLTHESRIWRDTMQEHGAECDVSKQGAVVE